MVWSGLARRRSSEGGGAGRVWSGQEEEEEGVRGRRRARGVGGIRDPPNSHRGPKSPPLGPKTIKTIYKKSILKKTILLNS